MSTQKMARLALGLVLGCGSVPFSAAGAGRMGSRQELTLAPAGPLHVAGGRLVDSRGRAFLIRGTGLPEFRNETVAYHTRNGDDFGSYSATSLAAVRLRFNMNTVRLPVAQGATLESLADLVRRANGLELLVILAGGGDDVAREFRDTPGVLFEAHSAKELAAIRMAGARQVVVVNSAIETGDSNVLRGVTPRFTELTSQAGRDAKFAAVRGPLLARWDLDLLDAAECGAIPGDPAAVAALVADSLDYFDRQRISWIASSFEAGKLIWELTLHDATKLDNGWTCAQPGNPPAGLGKTVQGHLRMADPRGLFVVGAAGGIEVARGGVAIAYGSVMAARDAAADSNNLPRTLGGLTVTVTDARGVARPAGILWASAGWGQVNIVVPEESALGPARMTITRANGSRLGANFTITETAPGFWTHVSCRGPAAGTMVYAFPDGRRETAALSACTRGRCESLPVRLRADAATRLHLYASGFRFARRGDIEVTIGGVRAPLVSYGVSGTPGKDDVVVEVPPSLRGLGETDLMARVNGRISNVVRVRIE